jgi:hypothetical protein
MQIDLYALAAPRSRADLLALALEAREEISRIHAHLDAMFAELEHAIEA